MHERPVLGGNASSEIGVRICGADRNAEIPHLRETGILEELRLANLYRNPQSNLFFWALALYEAAHLQSNLALLLNCSCLDAEMDGNRIVSVTGWQQSTQTWQAVHARIFADCSGDAILAPLSGADCRMGREARREYGESIAPEEADDKTMGMTVGWLGHDAGEPREFKPLSWVRSIEGCDDLPWGAGNHGYLVWAPWWCETGGEAHSIHDSEVVRDEALRISLGVWQHIKNDCVHSERARTWDLVKLNFMPGRRESRRYLGAHVLTQNDIESEGRHFGDIVAYGGWTMDDHHPGGFDSFRKYGQPPTIHHPAPSPYGIPYGCLYSRNVRNLMFAGRDASCTHTAMSSTRVMGTCCSMGQAVGAAAAIAVREGCDPAGVSGHIPELQQQLLVDDAYLPWHPLEVSDLCRSAALGASRGDPEPVRDGTHRQVGDDSHCWTARPGDTITYRFDTAHQLDSVMLVLDSAMEQSITFNGPGMKQELPGAMPKAFRVEVADGDGWRPVAQETDNYQRCLHLPVSCETAGVRFVLEGTRGAAESRIYAFLLNPPHAGGRGDRGRR